MQSNKDEKCEHQKGLTSGMVLHEGPFSEITSIRKF